MTQAKTENQPGSPTISQAALIMQALEIAESARAAGKFDDAVLALEFIAQMQKMGVYADGSSD